jgi:hypothetical protein
MELCDNFLLGRHPPKERWVCPYGFNILCVFALKKFNVYYSLYNTSVLMYGITAIKSRKNETDCRNTPV